jgi:glycosyltransferase involved in cell wall biosynthesis
LGNAAILVKPGREDVLANALLRLIKDKKLRRGLANKAKERAKIFDWKKLIPLYESVYKEALSLSIDSKMRR